MIKIDSLDDSRVQEFNLRKDQGLKKNNQIIAETEKIVIKLLKSSCKIEKILCDEKFYHKHSERFSGIDCYIAKNSLLEQIVGYHLHHGVFALAQRPVDIELSKLDEKILVLNGVTSPENIGSICRSAAAFGIRSLIVDAKSCSPYVKRCIRVSMGNIFSLKVFHSQDLKRDLEILKLDNYLIAGAANTEGAVEINGFNFNQKVALVIGSEGHGMDDEIHFSLDIVIKILVDEDVAHLNASVAAAVFLDRMRGDL